MNVRDEVEIEVLRAVERESCVHVAGIALAYPGVEPPDVARTVERLVALDEIAGGARTTRDGGVHDLSLTERGEARLAATRPDGDPH